ncbi:signal peptide protein : Uncharacterized protein OS=Pirellula staleyi (strain ATCC 27377 / DSM 6068 / ICPB 4128) GN=Psta_0306 PE=4 SV=1: Cytochrome_CBB3: PSD4: PSCyt3: PSD2 [Gemmataceae bacterium]|nr:signal peptide protein : Uncharacterized protein OS=Pirellula staleyi (strain ATCC 27377 / DSM 6068 / ICPB 4128) GN=Psta_0306 PE=4 SV=1: Cytochrome_CBB3: PSD4: PSCyt3: PSD2 [Gemmataceae bacterium]VTT96470.1 signal peptide protein : Uncharacterized protein OS=Pirellula staleyi (strain ATCC 27377 / DSM 6068 / ICPB 4128) GN=Psta_0306 PE=4 SV=1: Cytochrome_CBB3: PSD4: PSCyt3: PSD2 [Gemmataceae bacterium]
MPRLLLLVPALLAGLLGVRAADRAAPSGPAADLKFATPAESKAEFDRAVAPVLAKHCNACHNGKKDEGDLDLTALDPDMKATTSGARWAMVVEKVVAGEMPPKGKPRPPAEELAAVVRWARAEAKRSNRPFTRRAAYANGNSVPHAALFDPKNVPAFDGGPRVRRLSPEIYAAFTGELAKGKPGIAQPFSPEGKTTFKDMGGPKIDEPVTAQLIQNALAIAEAQTNHKVENGEVKAVGYTAKEFLALLDPARPPTDAQVEAAVAHQFNLILRRPPTDDERKRFAAFTRKNLGDAGPAVGLRYSLAAVLMLPEAVFRMEVGSGKPDAKGRVRLSPREIAFALSYGLTDRRPDVELLKAAATGELDTDAGVAKQARRLLDDSKTEKPRILRFFREYFGYAAATEVFKNDKDNPEHDARTLVEDTDRLILYVLEQDKDVLRELLTTNKSFVAYKTGATLKKQRAEALAKFEKEKAANPEKFKTKQPPKVGRSVYEAYGLKDFPDQQPADLPADQRAGILTQPSWLVANSTSDDNHAIHRGKWVRERLLGGVVPDVPITVDAQLPIAPEKTLRERMAVTEQEYCWKCHRLMNDVAYPFEQFDHFGRFRTAEAVLDPEATAKNKDAKGKPLGPVMKGVPVNAAGLVAHVGDPALEGPVTGAVPFLKKLAASERVEQVFVRHAFRYWTGRNESPGDAASLQAAQKAYRASGGSMKALVAALMSSESFLYRVPEAGAEK